MSIEIVSKQAILDIKPKAKADRNYRTNNLDDAYEDGFDDALNTIAEMPVAHMILLPNDTQEVRHGRWEYKEEHKGSIYGYYYCSICGMASWAGNSPYCPNCGASMRGEEE